MTAQEKRKLITQLYENIGVTVELDDQEFEVMEEYTGIINKELEQEVEGLKQTIIEQNKNIRP